MNTEFCARPMMVRTPKSAAGSMRRVGRVVAALAVAALIAAACSSDDDDASTEATDTPTAAADESDATADEVEETPTAAPDDATSEPEPEAEDEATPVPEGPREVIRIGYAFPDLEAFATLNADFGIGDPELQALAVVEGWRRDGLLPPGRDIELVFGKYNIIDTNEKLAVCSALAQDEDVFAVVSGLSNTPGAECLATRFGVPVIDTDSAPPSLYERGAPWFFTLRADQAAQLRTYAQWAIDGGYVQDKRVGMYFETKIEEGVAAMREQFAEGGIEIVSETETSGIGIGGAEDQLSVQRFIEDDVEVVLPIVGGSSAINVYSFAESQGYRPVYLDNDYSEKTTDAAAKANPPEQYEGTLAMTMTRIGENASGIENEAAETCLANYEQFSAQDVPREAPESGEYSSILRTCDLLNIVLAALTAAPEGELTREGFVAALESTGEIPLAGSGNGSFSAEDHSFVDEYRTIEWDGSCPCWKAVSDFAPMLSASG